MPKTKWYPITVTAMPATSVLKISSLIRKGYTPIDEFTEETLAAIVGPSKRSEIL